MNTYANLTGETIRIERDEIGGPVEFPPSPDHEPMIYCLDWQSDNDTVDRKAVNDDGLVEHAKPLITGLRLEPEPGVTYIVPENVANVMHGWNAPFDVVYPRRGGNDLDNGMSYTGLVRIV